MLRNAKDNVDENGDLTNQETRKLIKALLVELVRWTRLLKSKQGQIKSHIRSNQAREALAILFLIKTATAILERNKGRIINHGNSGTEVLDVGDEEGEIEGVDGEGVGV